MELTNRIALGQLGKADRLMWTQERILVNPDDPLFTDTSDLDKVRVKVDDREVGCPSSPLVTLLRRDIIENGQKVGHPAFFFLRIEKVEDKYVPWRGPPRPPPSSGAAAEVP